MPLGFQPMPFGYSLRGHCHTERRKDRWFGNPKGIVSSSPARNPKAERRPSSETRSPKPQKRHLPAKHAKNAKRGQLVPARAFTYHSAADITWKPGPSLDRPL